MSIEGKIDDLLEAGWSVLNSDFDPVAFHHWRRRALECLTEMLGPDHVYTQHFEKCVRQGGKRDLHAAGGILSAVRQGIAGSGLQSIRGYGCPEAGPDMTERSRGARNSGTMSE